MSALEDFLAKLSRLAGSIEPLVAFVATTQAAVGIGGTNAGTALQAIDAALRALEGYASGQHTAEQATASMAKLLDALVSNNAAADAELDARFKVPVGP